MFVHLWYLFFRKNLGIFHEKILTIVRPSTQISWTVGNHFEEFDQEQRCRVCLFLLSTTGKGPERVIFFAVHDDGGCNALKFERGKILATIFVIRLLDGTFTLLLSLNFVIIDVLVTTSFFLWNSPQCHTQREWENAKKRGRIFSSKKKKEGRIAP